MKKIKEICAEIVEEMEGGNRRSKQTEHVELGIKDTDNMWIVFSLKESRASSFPYDRAFGHLPEELKEKLNKATSEDGNVLDF